MKQIILKKDESRVIGVMLGASRSVILGSEATFSSHVRGEATPESARKDSGQAGMTNGVGKSDGVLDIVLAGDNASVEIVGLVMSKGSDERSLEAYITHAAPNTKSNVNVRAVLKDKSTFAFRGNVKIEKGAKGADAYLRSDALLFDDAKMGDDTPALEILEPDVKAGHAATIGKVDEQMLFYLMSRGLTRKQAEKMLVAGFIEPILNKITNFKHQNTNNI